MKTAIPILAAGLSLCAAPIPAFAQDEGGPWCGNDFSRIFKGHWPPPLGGPLIIDQTLTVTGLCPGEVLRGTGFNGLTGVLYASGSLRGIYTIDLDTGAASFLGAVSWDVDDPICPPPHSILCPWCPPPPPFGDQELIFQLTSGEFLKVTLGAAGLQEQLLPAPAYQPGDPSFGVQPNLIALTGLPNAGPHPWPWMFWAIDANTSSLVLVSDGFQQLQTYIHPLLPPPGVNFGAQFMWSMDDCMGPQPSPWLGFTYVTDSGPAPVTTFATLDPSQPAPAITPVGGFPPGIRFLDLTSLARICAADYNGDGFVNGDDFDAFSADFDAGNQAADVDGNGFVNGDDFDYFSQHFDAGC